jgi:hypothetical protein
MAAKISGKSLQEMTKAVSRHPGDRGIRKTSSHTTDALCKEFDKAMSQGGVEGRVKAMAIERVCDQMEIDLEEVVDSHRTDRHRRALDDARRLERAWHVIPSGKKPSANPFAAKRDSTRRIGTYSNTSPLVRQPDGAKVFLKKRRRPWK